MTDLDLRPDLTPAPTTLFASDDPAVVVARATRIADAIKPLIKDRHLYKAIGASEHVYLEGWTLAGTMLGVFATTVDSGPIYDADGHVLGYQATVEARTMAGVMVGRADAECTRDEPKWATSPSFQLRSMAQTRASSKALRMPLGFVMKLAGYETTPAEEMESAAARGETVSGGRGVRPGWRDINEQNDAHARLNVFLANNGLGEWVARWLDSKGYPRPLSKPQMSELRRAVDRELADRAGDQDAPTPTPGEGGRAGVEGANQSKPAADPEAPTSDGGTTGTPGVAAVVPRQQPPGGPKRSRPAEGKGKPPAGRAPTTEGRDAPDAVTVKQAGSADPEGNREGEADPSLTDDPSPVAVWCEEHDVDIRQARIFLRRQFSEHFNDLKDREDLVELRGERADRAVAYLAAEFGGE